MNTCPPRGQSVGLSAIPGGTALYRVLVRAQTTLDLDPEAVHQTGLERSRAHPDRDDRRGA